jgi:H+/Cl- antiporter ClcA
VSACLSKQHTKFLQGKEVNFFSKEDETKERLLLFCALRFLSLSLSLCFLSYKRSSLRRREEESSREILLLLLLLLLLLKLVLSLLCWGSFITKDDTAYAFSFAEWARVCFGRFALFLAYFLFWLLLSFGFGLCSAFYFGRTSFLSPGEDSFPLYPMRGKHIKVFIITHNI